MSIHQEALEVEQDDYNRYRFYIGSYCYSTGAKNDILNPYDWLAKENTQMEQWLTETIGNPWWLESESMDLDIGVNNYGVNNYLLVHEVYIIYLKDIHAIAHKLRWG